MWVSQPLRDFNLIPSLEALIQEMAYFIAIQIFLYFRAIIFSQHHVGLYFIAHQAFEFVSEPQNVQSHKCLSNFAAIQVFKYFRATFYFRATNFSQQHVGLNFTATHSHTTKFPNHKL